MADLLTAQFSTRNIDSSIKLRKSEIFEDFKMSSFIGKVFTPEKISHNTVAEYISSETGNDFLQYLQWLQMEDETNLMTLSSTHHYYYEMNDLKNIKIIINLKPLNSIKQLNSFLQTLVRLLPQESSFIGYFKNTDQNKSAFSIPQFSNFFQGFINYIDLKTDNSLTKREVSRLLEKHKLNVVDITDINGMTYLCSQAT